MAKYPYYLVPGNNVYKPWVKVTLGYKKTHKVTLPIMALVDSGADVCFCTKYIGLWLGVDFGKKSPTTFTAANCTKFDAIKEFISLYFAGCNFSCPFYFTDQLPRETPIVLGEVGFFDRFKITFDLKNRELEIV